MKTCILPNGLEIGHLNKGETDFLYREVFLDQAYDRHGLRLKDGDVVFDVGANIGLFALAVHLQCPAARVFSFEPIPEIFEVLRYNVERHGVNVRLYDCGLSDHAGSCAFTYYPGMSLMSGSYADPEQEEDVSRKFMTNLKPSIAPYVATFLRGKFEGRTVECSLKRFSDVLAETGVEEVALLKIDVEKSEMDVLRGIDDADWARIRTVVVEVHDLDGRLEQVRRLLDDRGFDVSVDQDLIFAETGLYNVYANRADP